MVSNKNEIDRFIEATEYLINKGIVKNKTQLAKEFEISKSKLSEILNKRMRPGFDLFNKLTGKFNFNAEWLLVGVGSMLKSTESAQNVQVFKSKTDHLIERQEIPLYEMEATAGIIDQLDNGGKHIPVDTIKIPNMPKADGAVFVTGDSMYPLLKSGDIVIFKRIEDIPNDIFWGEMYIVSMNISGEEYVTVKYVQKSDKGEEHIKLVSLNHHHQPKDVPLKKVLAMALVKASIRFNTMN